MLSKLTEAKGFFGSGAEELEEFYREVLEKASSVTVDRGGIYNTGKTSLRDYWRYGVHSPLNFINENFLRLERAMEESRWEDVLKVALDLINYTAHAYCFAKEQMKED